MKQGEMIIHSTQSLLIPRDMLSTPTQRNLAELEDSGFIFSDKAYMANIGYHKRKFGRGFEVPEEDNPRVPTGKFGKSFVIKGTDPSGAEVRYVRRETHTPGAGQTYLETPKGNLRITELKKLLKGEDLGLDEYKLRDRSGQIAKGALKHYQRARVNSMRRRKALEDAGLIDRKRKVRR